MKTLKDFTPEIQAKIPEYQNRVLEPIFNGSKYHNFDIEKAKKAIKWNYEKCGFKMPVVLVAENPLEQQYLFNYLNTPQSNLFRKIIYVLNNEFIEIELFNKKCKISSYFILFFNLSLLNNQLDSQLRSQLSSQLSSQLNSQLDSQLDLQLDSQLYSQLYSQLSSQLNSQLNSQLYLKNISNYNYNYLFTLNIYSEVYYTWFEFVRKEFNLNLTINDDFQECFNLHKESGIYSAIFSKEVCVISKYPIEIYQEPSQFRLNNIKGNSVVWSNSFAPLDCYYVNNLNISKELFNKLSDKLITFEDWIKEPNEEIKSAILSFYQQKFGNEFLFQFLSENLKEFNTFVDKKEEKYLEGTTKGMNIGVYTLFKGIVNNEYIAYVRCYCPSTDRMFFLGVNPENTNAKDAIASLYQIPKKLKDEIISIQRQGEVFSTNFTEKGLFLLKEMKQEDIQDMTSISGNDYFKLIQYEH